MSIGHLQTGIGRRVAKREAHRFWHRALLFGVIALGLYVATDAIAAWRYGGYSYRDQTISELSAVGAPTRRFWLAMMVPYQPLIIGLAVGILATTRGWRRAQFVGWLLLAYVLVGLLWPFAPMHQREVLAAGGDNWKDTMHLVIAGITSSLYLLMMVVGMGFFGAKFRVYTLTTIAALAVFGTLTSVGSGAVADNDSTPWLGIWERIVVFGSMAWIAVLGLMLYRDRTRKGDSQ
ncbi:MAG: DUF998 domain-containing protein [Dehalococcoidia bacterium]